MIELGKDHQPHSAEGPVANNRPIDHGQHVIDLANDAGTIFGIGQIGLASGSEVTIERHLFSPDS